MARIFQPLRGRPRGFKGAGQLGHRAVSPGIMYQNGRLHRCAWRSKRQAVNLRWFRDLRTFFQPICQQGGKYFGGVKGRFLHGLAFGKGLFNVNELHEVSTAFLGLNGVRI